MLGWKSWNAEHKFTITWSKNPSATRLNNYFYFRKGCIYFHVATAWRNSQEKFWSSETHSKSCIWSKENTDKRNKTRTNKNLTTLIFMLCTYNTCFINLTAHLIATLCYRVWRDSSVSIMTKLWTGQPRSWGSIPGRVKRFFSSS
jgi:hypothetical protein